jgi:putative transposase
MFLNQYGLIAEEQLHWLQQQYKYVILHDFIVMPNHIHAIIEISHTLRNGHGGLPINNRLDMQVKFKPLSELVGAYKTTSSKKIHMAGLKQFNWQRSFHDHIIKDEQSYYLISNYIRNNPSQWKNDKFYL